MYVPDIDTVKVWLRNPRDTRPNVGAWHTFIDRTTGKVTPAVLPGNTPLAAHVDETWVIALHYGTLGGEVVRLILLLGGPIPVALLVTGVDASCCFAAASRSARPRSRWHNV